MEKLLSKDSVNIIRKKGEDYYNESISTRKMLPGTAGGEMEIRKNVIARLRNDPSVVVVLEDIRGHSEETFEHKGFIIEVFILDDDKPYARLKITYDGNIAYEERYMPDTEEDDYYNSPLYKLLHKLESILYDIDHEDYSFVKSNCPGFVPCEPEEEVESMDGMVELLEKHNYQIEKLYTIDYAAAPYLFVHENEVMLLGERHFSGQFFVEMKRIWEGISARIIAKAIEEIPDKGGVRCFQYEDGSWGFRTDLYDRIVGSNFEKLLDMAICKVKEVVEKIECNPEIGPEVFSISDAQRSLFIYEVIDASLKLSKLSI